MRYHALFAIIPLFGTAACGKIGDIVNPDSPDSDAQEKFQVIVNGGSGSGYYAPGQTVTVWSGVSTQKEVVLPWSGDSLFLSTPVEWVTHFTMPKQDVVLQANVKTQTLNLKVEKYTGSTKVEKDVRYFFPENMKGLVFISHGTGGTSKYIEKPETFAIALALVEKGFGVLSTEAEEAVAGDLNGDGKTRWQTGFTSANVDLKNLSMLLQGLENRGLITAATPKFALGMSNGGAFSHFLGAVSASSIAASFPKLKFNAVLGYCADAGQIYKRNDTKTPSAWYMCAGEDNPEVSLSEAKENEARVRSLGVPTEYKENKPTPLYDERFARVPGVSLESSKAMAEELRAAGYVDDKGFLNKDADQIALDIIAPENASRFPAFLAVPGNIAKSLKQQLKAMRAEHALYADLSQSNIAFFERFLP